MGFVYLYGEETGLKGIKTYYTASYSDTGKITASAFCFKKGESVFIDGDFDLKSFEKEKRLDLKFKERAGGREIYYYTYPLARYSERINGVTVNMQIAVSEEGVTVGVPVIYGSF